MDNLDKSARFEEAIDGAADAEISALLDAAKARAEKAVASADEKYLEENFELISHETKRIKNGFAREISRRSFEASKEVFAHRNRCIESLFEEAAKEIAAYSETAEYDEALKKILSEINDERPFEEKSVIYVKPNDTEKAGRLYPKLTVQPDKNIKLGGASVFYPSDSVFIDKTYDNAFEGQKAEFVNNRFMQF